MERTLRFYKESSGRWFADIPEWTGDKDDLEMILGANVLLDIVSEDEGEVKIYFSTESFNGANVLELMNLGVLGDISHGGGTYKLHEYMGIVFDLDVWLCDVTRFVFGEIPVKIYFK